MERNELLELVRPQLQSGNRLTYSDFDLLFGNFPTQDQEQFLADLTALGILIGRQEAPRSGRKAVNRYTNGFPTKQLQGMTNEQLCMLAQQGNADAMDILTRKTMRFVHLMAQRVPQLFAHTCLTDEDNFQNGILGLNRAIQRFDATLGYRFLTYAAYWIRQSILLEAINTGLTVRIPVYYFETLCRVRVICTRFLHLNGFALWNVIAKEEIYSGHPCTVEQARTYLADMSVYLNITSLNLMIGEDYDTELSTVIIDNASPSLEELVEQHESVQIVRSMLDRLSSRESLVLRLRYGIPDGRCHTLDEVSVQLGITRERVRQIQHKAECHLRRFLYSTWPELQRNIPNNRSPFTKASCPESTTFYLSGRPLTGGYYVLPVGEHY